MTEKKESCLVVLSGGQDSVTCLFQAVTMYDNVKTISFDYGQRHKKELELAKRAARVVGASHIIIPVLMLNQLTSNALTRPDIEVAVGVNGGLPTTFVDGRNMMFLTLAAIYAKQHGIKDIITGVCQTDFSGYPDCRDMFIKSLNVTLNLAMSYDFVIHTPLMWLTKAQTWAIADELGVMDYVAENTLTCYNGIQGEGCEECPACLLRANGLHEYILGENK